MNDCNIHNATTYCLHVPMEPMRGHLTLSTTLLWGPWVLSTTLPWCPWALSTTLLWCPWALSTTLLGGTRMLSTTLLWCPWALSTTLLWCPWTLDGLQSMKPIQVQKWKLSWMSKIIMFIDYLSITICLAQIVDQNVPYLK